MKNKKNLDRFTIKHLYAAVITLGMVLFVVGFVPELSSWFSSLSVLENVAWLGLFEIIGVAIADYYLV